MREGGIMKEKDGKEKSGKLNIGTIIAVLIAVIALAGSVFTFLIGGGMGGEESKVSEKELKAARALYNSDSTEEGMNVIGIDENIVVSAGASSGHTVTDSNQSSSESTTATSGNGDYIFANSGSVYLTDADVSGLSKADLRIARNEIMARHGRIFDSADLKAYFESKSWYNGTVSPEEFDESMDSRLNDVERANIEMIKKYE